jgi:hypothetical protein
MPVYKRVDEDYKKLFDEQSKVLKILAKRCREKQTEITKLNKEMARLRNIIRTQKRKWEN